MISLGDLSYAQLPNLPLRKRLEKGQIEKVCKKLANRIRGRLEKEWSAMFRAPASSMYDKASLSFSNTENLIGDCWGHPFAFDLAFGSGVVKVRCEGVTTPVEPDAEKAPDIVTSPENTQKPQPTDRLTISEAAAYAGKSTKTIRSWLQRKTGENTFMLPNTIGSGRMVRILRSDLDIWRKAKNSTPDPTTEPQKRPP